MTQIADLALNSDWDIYVTNRDLTTTSGASAVEQHLGQRLKEFQGEWFLELRDGVPYHQEFFKKDINPTVIDYVLKMVIIETPGILELLEFELDFDQANRELNLTFRAKSYDGIINYSTTL